MSTSLLRVLAPAKINLFLHVGHKREDGFHALESLVVFAGAADTLIFEPAADLSLTLDGPFAGKLTADADNLVFKAAHALAAARGLSAGARITLSKHLPVASGIGGGSADAAAALRGLNALWQAGAAADELRAIGVRFGSDIPVCVESLPAWMAGRGERVTILSGIPRLPMVLVNPGVAVPTGPVFRALETRRGVGLPIPAGFADTAALLAYLKTTTNDLEAPARVIAPAVGAVLDAIAEQDGVLLSRMSGSGATCFGLFESDAAAAAARRALAERHAGWWVAAG